MPVGRVGVWCSCTGDRSAGSLVGNAPLWDVGKGQGGAKEPKFWLSLLIPSVAVQKMCGRGVGGKKLWSWWRGEVEGDGET